MLTLTAFLVMQTATAHQEVVAPPGVKAQMDRLFALPVFAPFAPSYKTHTEFGLKLEKLTNFYMIRIDAPKMSEYSYSLWFDQKTWTFSWFEIDHYDAGPEHPRPELARFLREALAQIEPDVPRPDLRFRDWGADYEVSARRVAYGRPIADELRIGANVVTGRLALVDPTDYTIDPAPYGDDRILDAESLREFGYGQYAQHPFEQAELVTEEVVINLPFWIKREREPRYADLGYHGIPTYVMKWETEYGSYFEVQMDARDGTVFHAIRASAMGASEKPPVPVPEKVQIGRQTGRIARTDRTAESPQGLAALFTAGKTAFSGLFDAKNGDFWYRPDARQPYRGYRPELKLRKALEAQVRRNGVTTKK